MAQRLGLDTAGAQIQARRALDLAVQSHLSSPVWQDSHATSATPCRPRSEHAETCRGALDAKKCTPCSRQTPPIRAMIPREFVMQQTPQEEAFLTSLV